jgi:hypothetical protein
MSEADRIKYLRVVLACPRVMGSSSFPQATK